jgi:hypothetical protein
VFSVLWGCLLPVSFHNFLILLRLSTLYTGVGFSYTASEEDKHTGDAKAATDNYNLILSFLEKFPERRSNPFYIASESYGGHYMPQLALEILENDLDHAINFKGFMVGNPFVELYTNLITQFESYYSHGLVAKPLFDKWRKTCNDRGYYHSDECQGIMEALLTQSHCGAGINPYALDYPVRDIPKQNGLTSCDCAYLSIVSLVLSSSPGVPRQTSSQQK